MEKLRFNGDELSLSSRIKEKLLQWENNHSDSWETLLINDTGDDHYDSKMEKARAIVIDNQDLIYVCNMNNSYVLPGGTVENGESAGVTIERELAEELGIENAHPIPFRNVHYYHEGFPVRGQEGGEKRLIIVDYFILPITASNLQNSNFTEYEKAQNMKVNVIP